MKIENVVYTPEIFRYNRVSLYKDLYAAIEGMGFKKQIKVSLDAPVKNINCVQLHFRKIEAEFKLRIRKADEQGRVWHIAKFDLDE